MARAMGCGLRRRRVACSLARSSVKSSVVRPDVVKMAARSVGTSDSSMWRSAAMRTCIRSACEICTSSKKYMTKRLGTSAGLITAGASWPPLTAGAVSGLTGSALSLGGVSTGKEERGRWEDGCRVLATAHRGSRLGLDRLGHLAGERLDGKGGDGLRFAFIEELEVFLAQIADRAPLFVPDDHRHQQIGRA